MGYTAIQFICSTVPSLPRKKIRTVFQTIVQFVQAKKPPKGLEKSWTTFSFSTETPQEVVKISHTVLK